MNDERPLHVLLAEDDPELRALLADSLRKRGHGVTAVENGAHALHTMEECIPDAIVLDVWMPVLSGIDVLQRLRAHDVFIPVVLMTGACDDEVLAAAEQSQASVVFDKPVDPSLICEAVQVVARLHGAEMLRALRAAS